jgi:glycosyltransferase 2 family protein
MSGKPINIAKLIFQSLRLLGIVLFVVILFRVDLKAIGKTMLDSDAWLLAVAVVFQLLVLLSKGIRWHLMNSRGNSRAEWKLSLGRFYESYAVGVVTPARMGELLKAGHEKGKNNIIGSALRVLAERGLDIGIFLSLAGLSVASGYYTGFSGAFGLWVVAGALLIILLSVLMLVSRHFITLLNKVLNYLPGKFKTVVLEPKRYPAPLTLQIFLLSIFSNLSYFISCYYLGLAAGLEANFIWISGAVAVSGLLNMLPVTIMGLGTRELIFLYVFQTFDQDVALAFSFLVVLVAQIGGGLVALVAGQLLLLNSKKIDHE